MPMSRARAWALAADKEDHVLVAEIVPPHLRNMVYAFDRSFEGALAACGAPLVGILAEDVFGFKVGWHILLAGCLLACAALLSCVKAAWHHAAQAQFCAAQPGSPSAPAMLQPLPSCILLSVIAGHECMAACTTAAEASWLCAGQGHDGAALLGRPERGREPAGG